MTWRDHAHDRDVDLNAAALFRLMGAAPCTTALIGTGVELDGEGSVVISAVHAQLALLETTATDPSASP